MPRNRRSRRGFSGSMNYIQQESEQNAVAKMEMSFKKDKFEASENQRAILNKKSDIRFDAFETTERIKNIKIKATPIMNTLLDPTDINEEEMKKIKQSINSFSDEIRYTENDLDRAAYSSQITLLEKMYNNASELQDATRDFNTTRNAISNLITIDEEGTINAGKFNAKNTAEIMRNSERNVVNYSKSGSKDLVSSFNQLKEDSSTINFIANELDYYKNKKAQGTLSIDEEGLYDKALRLTRTENFNDAYEVLNSMTDEETLGRKNREEFGANAKISMDEATRKLVASNNGIINALPTDSGTHSAALRAFQGAIQDSKGDFIYDSSSDEAKTVIRQALNSAIEKIKDDDAAFMGSEILSNYQNIGTSKQNNNLEAISLILSGVVSMDDERNIVYPDGDVFMNSSGIIINPYGTKALNADWYSKWQTKIDLNLKKLVYKSTNNNDRAVRNGYAAMARIYLRLDDDIANRTSDSTKSAPTDKEENIKQIQNDIDNELINPSTDESISLDISNIASKPEGADSNVSMLEKSKIVKSKKSGTSVDYSKNKNPSVVDTAKNVKNAIQKNNADANLERSKKRLAKYEKELKTAGKSKIPTLQKLIVKTKKLISKQSNLASAYK